MGRKNGPSGRSSRRGTQGSGKYNDYDYDYDRRDGDRGRDYRSDRDRDRDRARDRRREDERRDYDGYRSRSDHRDRGDRDDRRDRRDRERGGADHYRRSARDEPKREKGTIEKRLRTRRRDRRGGGVPPVSRHFNCHICVGNHWTTDCPRLRLHPEDYPLMNSGKGCCQCGQRGHRVADCTRRKYHCRECGGVHDTKDCVYTHNAEEWHEFMDPVSKHVFYVNYADPTEVQWNPPSHKLDVILWYCPGCQVMIPTQYNECLKCHTARPVSVEDDATSSEEDDSSSYSDESDSSSGSNATESSSSSDSDRD